MNAPQRISKGEQSQILDLVRANGLDMSKLACFMTRQQDSGRGRHPNGQAFNISYNLMLCKYCGNHMPSAVCPAKANDIKERLRQLEA